ncbi:unnamed protein product [Phyllotreta striolata]|uniref:G-patch domain-containing protein n=1 Tax=Phyllotreta striolata TaxID=444603 RepID=A0A9N9XRC2_PHYSR|nr:unnamed protein product [Phyllotreta striolata]
MSMLAEPRRKQKWSLNPRGKEWSQDTNKFGQKLLEKMGWKHGKGLGAKENGITEHVKVSYKNDSAGMGFKESNDQWTEHESNFSALLQSLTCEEIDISTKKFSSLEEKSQASRARVHYHKFTRGKDLSRASEKDLASIFGKKSLKKPTQNETETNKDNINQDETEKTSSEFLVNAGSMADYFKKKLPSFGKTNRYVVGANGVLKMEECDIIKPTFGFGYISSKLKSNDTNEEDGNNKRKIDSDSEKAKKKLKTDDDCGVSNPAYNPMSTPIKIKKRFLNPIAEEADENSNTSIQTEGTQVSDDSTQLKKVDDDSEIKPKKRKNKNIIVHENIRIDNVENTNGYMYTKKKTVKQLEVDNPTFNEAEEVATESSKVEENPYEIKPKKKKKAKQLELDNPTFNETEEAVTESSNMEENPYEVKTKKKKKAKQLELDNPTFNESREIVTESSNIEDNPYEVKLKKKKKSKQLELDNPVFNESEDVAMETSNIEENPYEVKLKKKKRTKQSEDNPTFNATDDVVMKESNQENPYEIKPKKKKTKQLEIDNPTFNESNEVAMETTTIEVNPYEIKPKKKKKSKSLAIDNLGYTENQEPPKEDSNRFEVASKKIKKKDKGVTNPALDLSNSNEIECDLVLNVTSTPVTQEETVDTSKTNGKSSKRTKDLQQLIKKKSKKGVDNHNFNKQQTQLDENVDAFAKTIDNCQAEVENDLNEAKTNVVTVDDIMVGEVGNPHGDNEQLPDGTKLKFRLANLNKKTPVYHINQMGPKKSYKHLIKGDILLTFKNTNLHEVNGYGDLNKL